MTILGLSAYYHDSAAALARDGEIVAAAQEGRFTRKKHDHSFPRDAVAYCLREAGITPKQLDRVVFYHNPFQQFERLLETYLDYAPPEIRSFLGAMPLWLREKLWMREHIACELDCGAAVLFTEHHESHAASAFFPSPFDSAAILTIDDAGEWATRSYVAVIHTNIGKSVEAVQDAFSGRIPTGDLHSVGNRLRRLDQNHLGLGVGGRVARRAQIGEAGGLKTVALNGPQIDLQQQAGRASERLIEGSDGGFRHLSKGLLRPLP